jgi:hypothetical protein
MRASERYRAKKQGSGFCGQRDDLVVFTDKIYPSGAIV